MKKVLFTTLFGIVGILLLAQQNPARYYFEAGGPPAGEVWEEVPTIPGSNYSLNRALDYDSLNMQFIGNWPFGQSMSVSSSPTGDTVFYGSGAGVLVYDAQNPYNPVQIADIRARALVDHSFYDASSKILFLAAYFSGVEIWDLNDMENPHRLSRIPLNSYPRGGIFAGDGYLYIVTVADGIYIADISDLSNPQIISHQPITGSLVWTSSYEGDRIYASAGTSGLRIVNVSDPYNPFIEQIFETNATGIIVKNDTGYVLASDFGLRIYDFSNLSSIVQLGELAITGYPMRLTKANDHLYIANSTTSNGGGVTTVNISDPANPVYVTTTDPPETYISGSGNVIAASGNIGGLLLLDISDPADPQYAAETGTAWSTVNIAASGDYAYIGSGGFRVLDMSDPAWPIQIGYNETQGAITSLDDTLAVYIPKSMGSGNHVNIMNIADKENPLKSGHYSPPVMTYDLCVKDNHAYVACWWDGFRVVNYSDPENPYLLSHELGWVNGAIPGEEYCFVQALDTYGNTLYVLDYGPFEDEDTKGLYIWDITNPQEPVRLNRYVDMLSKGNDIKVWGDYAYISDQEGGLEIINVADPLNPFSVSYLPLMDVAWDIDISYPYVYVSQYIMGGVHIVDVSDPANPEISAYYLRSGCFALGVTAWDRYALVADGPAGMQVYDNLLATSLPEEDIGVKDQIYLFPNPAGTHISIRYNAEGQENVHIKVFDLMGRCLFSQEYPPEDEIFYKTIQTDNLSPGMYVLELSSGDDVNSRKFIKK